MFRRPGAAARTPAPKRGGAALPRSTPRAAPTPTAPTPGSAFATRTRSGEVVATLNGHLEAAPAEERAETARAVVRALGPPLPTPARTLTDGLADRAAYIDGRIATFEAALVAAGAPAADAAVGVAAHAPGVFVGRVAADADAAGRLDPGSVWLEGGVARSDGRRARLDLSAVNGAWRVFPGQTLAVAGACPAGHTLVAAALAPSAPPPAARSRRGELAGFAARAGGAGVRVVAAAGPFTSPADVAFEGLDAVLAAAAGDGAGGGRPADAVVLVGPFVPADHPAVARGALDRTLDAVFEDEVIGRLVRFAAACQAAGRAPPPVVLVPSPADAVAAPVFPTPPLTLPPTTPPNVLALPNPATFAVNEVVIGVTGHDVLRDLSGAQAESARARAGAAGAPALPPRDRLASLAGALLEQASFYPLYPPAPGSFLDAGAAAASGGLRMRVAPDLLILPSALAPFARVATAVAPPTAGGGGSGASAVAVNPGRAVAPGGGAGTLALLTLAPLGLAPGGDPDDAAPHAVGDRCRVEVVRV